MPQRWRRWTSPLLKTSEAITHTEGSGMAGIAFEVLGEISWQPCNYLLVGIVRQSACSLQMLPSWSPSSPGTPICEVWGHIVQQPNSESSVSKMIWNTEALMAPHLSPKATPTEGGSHVKLCFCQQAESPGSLTWLSIARRSLSLHLICIWDIN